jgi:hypothetical protein
MKIKSLSFISVVSLGMILILASVGIHSAAGHERRLYTIGSQDYLFVVGSMNNQHLWTINLESKFLHGDQIQLIQ